MPSSLFIGLVLAVVLYMYIQGKNRIPPEQAKQLVDEGAILLDVRTQAEFKDVHAPGAKNIPVAELGGQLSQLPKDKKVVVYCQSGMRSGAAVRQLKKAGYEAFDLGPLARWPG